MTAVTIEKVRDRIHLRSPYPTPGLGRRIPGASFSTTGGAHWSFPLSMDVCRQLRSEFTTRLKVGSDLAAWARTAIEEESRMSALGAATDATLQRVPGFAPKLAKAMESRTYQRVGARFIAEGRSVLIADQPGLGKTLEALGGIVESGARGPYLVVCPKTAVEAVWRPEITRWLAEMKQRVITVPDGRVHRNGILNPLQSHWADDYYAKTWVVVHPEMIRAKSFWVCPECRQQTPVKAGPKKLVCDHDPKNAPRINEYEYPQLFAPEWGAIILDESQRMLIRRTGTPTQTRNGAELLRLREGGLRIALSGSPDRSRPHLLWGTLNWLRPKEFTSFWNFAGRYFEMSEGWGGSKVVGALRPDREADLFRSLDRIMLRRTKAEVAKDLPPKQYGGTPLVDGDEGSPVGVWLPMDGRQRRAYEAMQKDSVAVIEGGELNAIGVLAEMTRLKQFATSCGRIEESGEFKPALPSNKFDYLLETLTEMGFPDQPDTKVVVVSQFTSVLELFAREMLAFGIDSVMLTGAVTGAKRTEAIERFNSDEGPHLMFLNTKAGGVAITIDTADEMIFLDETWVADDQEQAEDRIHRVSRPRQVTYRYLRTLGSIEEGIAVTNAEAEFTSKAVLDGRRGVEFAKKVLAHKGSKRG